MTWLVAGIVLIGVLYVIVRLSRKIGDKMAARKVIKLSLNRGDIRYANRQKCGFCGKKTKPLVFYADERGKAVGVCQLCRPIAERRALLKL